MQVYLNPEVMKILEDAGFPGNFMTVDELSNHLNPKNKVLQEHGILTVEEIPDKLPSRPSTFVTSWKKDRGKYEGVRDTSKLFKLDEKRGLIRKDATDDDLKPLAFDDEEKALDILKEQLKQQSDELDELKGLVSETSDLKAELRRQSEDIEKFKKQIDDQQKELAKSKPKPKNKKK